MKLKLSTYDHQIQLDIRRTYPQETWFVSHREQLRYILNTFSILNKAFGYPQGLNFLAFPLYYVYYNDDPENADMDTLYSLQTLIHVVLPMYPIDEKDTGALFRIRQITNLICFKCYENENKLHFLLDTEYEQFMTSMVSNILPTFFASTFSLKETIDIWDKLFKKNTLKNVLEGLVEMTADAITYHKNIFIYLPIHTAMEVFHVVLRQSAVSMLK